MPHQGSGPRPHLTLRAAQVGMVRTGPAQSCAPQRMGDHPCGLSERRLEPSASLARRRGLPDRGGDDPDRRRTAAPELRTTGWPVPGLAGEAVGQFLRRCSRAEVRSWPPSDDLNTKARAMAASNLARLPRPPAARRWETASGPSPACTIAAEGKRGRLHRQRPTPRHQHLRQPVTSGRSSPPFTPPPETVRHRARPCSPCRRW